MSDDTIQAVPAEAEADIWNEMEASDSGASEDAPELDGFQLPPEPGDGEENDDPTPAAADTGASHQDAPEEAATAEEVDEWAKVPEALRTQYQQTQAALDDMKSRHSGNTRKIRELTEELTAIRQAKPPANPAGGKPDDMTDKEWASFKEDYPDIAGPLEAKMQANAKALESFERRFASMDAAEVKKQYDSNFEDVQKNHPDYLTIVRDPAFPKWIEEQPRYIQEGAARNGQEIVDPVEVADIIGRYKQDAGIGAEAINNPGGSSGQGSSQSLASKRARQLSATQGAGRKSAPALAAGIPDTGDPDELWEAFERQDAAKAKKA